MADFVFNVGKGVTAEKVNDGSASIGVMVIKTAESDALLKTRTTLTNVLAHNTEAGAVGYSRKTGLTGTVTVDQTNNRVDVSIPNQTWTGVAVGETWAKVIVYYEDAAADGTRIPLTAHDFVVTTDGSDITVQFAAAGFYRAS